MEDAINLKLQWTRKHFITFASYLIYELGHTISYRTAWAPSEDSDQSLMFIRRHFGSLATHRVPCRLWSDFADADADFSLSWAHMQSCRKCCARTHIAISMILYINYNGGISTCIIEMMFYLGKEINHAVTGKLNILLYLWMQCDTLLTTPRITAVICIIYSLSSEKHTYIILTPLNPTFI